MTCAAPSDTYCERQLWAAVILRAIHDSHSTAMPAEDRYARRAADAWLRGNSNDYRNACALAGVDPDYLRGRYLAGKVGDVHRSYRRVAAE